MKKDKRNPVDFEKKGITLEDYRFMWLNMKCTATKHDKAKIIIEIMGHYEKLILDSHEFYNKYFGEDK